MKKIITILGLVLVLAVSAVAVTVPANAGTKTKTASVKKKAKKTTKKKTKKKKKSEKKGSKMKVKITVGDHTIHATLYDNAAAKKLYKSIPVTYPMMNLYDREMCYRMGAGSLPTKEAKDKSYKVGDISYWPPAGSLVILYAQNGEVFEQQPIGHTDDDISFFNGMEDTDITFEKE